MSTLLQHSWCPSHPKERRVTENQWYRNVSLGVGKLPQEGQNEYVQNRVCEHPCERVCARMWVHKCVWVCGYEYVCVCVCLWMCVSMNTCACLIMCMFLYVCANVCVCVWTGMYNCECVWVYEYVSVCPWIYVWVCVYVYERVYEHVSMDMCVSEWVCACVCDGGTWHDHLSSSPLQVSQCPSCYALHLSRLTSHMWQSELAESGLKCQACLFQALWPYASHWASRYLGVLSCERQIALLHRIGERKQQGLPCGCITCASFTLPLRFSLMAGTRQAQGRHWSKERIAAAHAALTPDSSTQGLCESPGCDNGAANTTHQLPLGAPSVTAQRRRRQTAQPHLASGKGLWWGCVWWAGVEHHRGAALGSHPWIWLFCPSVPFLAGYWPEQSTNTTIRGPVWGSRAESWATCPHRWSESPQVAQRNEFLCVSWTHNLWGRL